MPKPIPRLILKRLSRRKQFKDQPKTVSLLRRKSYWVTLTLAYGYFQFSYGYLTGISVAERSFDLG